MSPWAPKKPCCEPGCGARVPAGVRRCPQHEAVEAERRRQYDRDRTDDPIRRFHVSGPWRRLRAAFAREHPECMVPGCGHPTEHIDHIIGIRQGGPPLDWANLQALCRFHHSQKSARAGERWPRRG